LSPIKRFNNSHNYPLKIYHLTIHDEIMCTKWTREYTRNDI